MLMLKLQQERMVMILSPEDMQKLLGMLMVASLVAVSGVAYSKALHFPKAWNKTFLPFPFAKVQVIWEGPWGPANRETDPRDEKIARELEDLLHSANKKARKVFAANDP